MTMIASIDVAEVEFKSTTFARILCISLRRVLSVTFNGIITGILLFKYRWQIRWQWLQMKRKIRFKREKKFNYAYRA